MDAHVLRTGERCGAEGITSLATVHDSFGCLPSRAEHFRKIIREQFVQMYEENDVLAQVLEQARKDLGENAKLPDEPPQKGALDIRNVLEAVFAFA
jgi:DNA-directed RNA polymerase